MGEVYRARDTRLSRDVAIKVLPDGFATDPERLARFKREAHVLDSPNQICEAIEVAHEHGVIHRDLKPSNIKLTLEQGQGARLWSGESDTPGFGKPLPDLANKLPTITSPIATSGVGVLLGTAAYMYEIVGSIGAGGMGEVYRGRDSQEPHVIRNDEPNGVSNRQIN